jgi:hypothetical protein
MTHRLILAVVVVPLSAAMLAALWLAWAQAKGVVE